MKNWTKDWLRRARITNDSAGDLITDMRTDTNIPPLFASIREMRDYVRGKGARAEAIAAVPIVWRRYRNWMDHHALG
jgi:hypothetical protein